MTALIEFICRVHTEPRGAGPLITPVYGGWGYCEGYGSGGHKWTRIEPTSRAQIADASPIRELRSSYATAAKRPKTRRFVRKMGHSGKRRRRSDTADGS